MVKCFYCKKECNCKCFEIDTDMGTIFFCSLKHYNKSNNEFDWDAEFGDYQGHHAECTHGGNFRRKHAVLVKQLNIWRDMANEKHRILHKIGYFKTQNSEPKGSTHNSD